MVLGKIDKNLHFYGKIVNVYGQNGRFYRRQLSWVEEEMMMKFLYTQLYLTPLDHYPILGSYFLHTRHQWVNLQSRLSIVCYGPDLQDNLMHHRGRLPLSLSLSLSLRVCLCVACVVCVCV